MSTVHQESRSQHPADPVDEALALIQAFADTGATQGADALATREEAVAWLREQGLLAAGSGLMNNEYNALVRLRSALRDVLAAQAEGRDDADAAARLTKGLADGRLVVTVGPAATVELDTAARAAYPTIVASLAVAIARAAAAGRWPAR
jgi:Putative stress-induced transcription regulator